MFSCFPYPISNDAIFHLGKYNSDKVPSSVRRWINYQSELNSPGNVKSKKSPMMSYRNVLLMKKKTYPHEVAVIIRQTHVGSALLIFAATRHLPICRKVDSYKLCPIFQVSNVSGENLQLLKTFLNLLTTKMEYKENEPAEFQIDDTYSVPGVGTVISGTTLKGVIRLNDTLMLGPDLLGHFQPIAIKSIHRKRMVVKEVRAGQTASFALKKIKRSQIRKGMVMVSPVLNPQSCWEFEGEILILHHPTTISSRYQAMVHCGSIRQTASIVSMSKDCLRTGDKASIHFRFIKHPEYLIPGQRLVFREGRTKAVGNITRIFTTSTPTHAGNRNKQNKQMNKYNSAAKCCN